MDLVSVRGQMPGSHGGFAVLGLGNTNHSSTDLVCACEWLLMAEWFNRRSQSVFACFLFGEIRCRVVVVIKQQFASDDIGLDYGRMPKW